MGSEVSGRIKVRLRYLAHIALASVAAIVDGCDVVRTCATQPRGSQSDAAILFAFDSSFPKKWTATAISCLLTFILPEPVRAYNVIDQPKDNTPSSQLAKPAPPSKDDDAAQSAEAELKELYRQGSAAYSGSDYLRAIEAFRSMLAILEESTATEGEKIRGATLYNLGRAYRAAYGLELDARYLRLARDTFRRYLREADHGYQYSDVDGVRGLLIEVEAELELIQEKEETSAIESGPQTLGQGPAPDIGLSEAAKYDQNKLRLTLKRSRWIGWSSMGLGVASAGFATFGAVRGIQAEQKFVEQEDPDDRKYSDAAGEQANLFVYVGSGVAAVSAGVGVIFLARALRSKRRLKRLELQSISVGHQMGLSFRF